MTSPNKTSAAERAEEARQHTAISQSRHLLESAGRARRAQLHTAADRYLRLVLESLEGIDTKVAQELREKSRAGLDGPQN